MLLPLAFALPHIFYAIIWLSPKILLAHKNPVDRFAYIATLLKLFQFIVLLHWYLTNDPSFLSHLDWLTGFACLLLLLVGQTLNYAIYAAIGYEGVYYGTRLGCSIPWHTGFPFSVWGLKIPHPQYLGSILTVWAIVLAIHHSPATNPILYLGYYSTTFYTITAVIEDFF
jgi:hypothetical protein